MQLYTCRCSFVRVIAALCVQMQLYACKGSWICLSDTQQTGRLQIDAPVSDSTSPCSKSDLTNFLSCVIMFV